MTPPLHVIVTDEVAARAKFDARAGDLMEACGPRLALHLRLRESSDSAFHRRAAALTRAARDHGTWIVVNGRVDVALAVRAHAVQLGAGALPLTVVRRLAGPETAIGVSVHSEEEARTAAEGGANYLLLGTIYPTPSHPGRRGAGTALVAACAGFGTPVVAIGGITRERVAPVLAAGASGVAVVRAVWNASRPTRAARDLIAELESGS